MCVCVLHIYVCKYIYVYAYIYIYSVCVCRRVNKKSNAIFNCMGIITDRGTCTIHQNGAGSLYITSILLNTVTFPLNIKFSNECAYPCLVKFF